MKRHAQSPTLEMADDRSAAQPAPPARKRSASASGYNSANGETNSKMAPSKSLESLDIAQNTADAENQVQDSGDAQKEAEPQKNRVKSSRPTDKAESVGENEEEMDYSDGDEDDFDNSDLYDFDDCLSERSKISTHDLDDDLDEVEYEINADLFPPDEDYTSNGVFDDLPDEIIHRIGYYLHPFDRFHYASSCRRIWNATSSWCDVISVHIFMKPNKDDETHPITGATCATDTDDLLDEAGPSHAKAAADEAGEVVPLAPGSRVMSGISNTLAATGITAMASSAVEFLSIFSPSTSAPSTPALSAEALPTAAPATAAPATAASAASVDTVAGPAGAASESVSASSGSGATSAPKLAPQTGASGSASSPQPPSRQSSAGSSAGGPAPIPGPVWGRNLRSLSDRGRAARVRLAPRDIAPAERNDVVIVEDEGIPVPNVQEAERLREQYQEAVIEAINDEERRVIFGGDELENLMDDEFDDVDEEEVLMGARLDPFGAENVLMGRGRMMAMHGIGMPPARDPILGRMLHDIRHNRRIDVRHLDWVQHHIEDMVMYLESRRRPELMRRRRLLARIAVRQQPPPAVVMIREGAGVFAVRRADYAQLSKEQERSGGCRLMVQSTQKPFTASPPHDVLIQGFLRNPFHPNNQPVPFETVIKGKKLPTWLRWFGVRVEKMALTLFSCIGMKVKIKERNFAWLLFLVLQELQQELNGQFVLCPAIKDMSVNTCIMKASCEIINELTQLVRLRVDRDKAITAIRLDMEKDCSCSRPFSSHVQEEMEELSMLRSALPVVRTALADYDRMVMNNEQQPDLPYRDRLVRCETRLVTLEREFRSAMAPAGDPHGGPPGQGRRSGDRINAIQRLVDTAAPGGLQLLSIDNLLYALRKDIGCVQYPPTLFHLISKRIRMNSAFIPTLKTSCPQIESLQLVCGIAEVDNANYENLAAMAQLKHIKFDHGPTEAVLTGILNNVQHIPPAMANIMSVITERFDLCDRQLGLLRNCFGDLETIELNCSQEEVVSTRAWHTFLRDMTNLKHFVINNNSNVIPPTKLCGFDDSILDTLADKCPKLQTLYISCPTACTADTLPRLMKNCPQLELIHLEGLVLNLKNLDGVVMFMGLQQDLNTEWVIPGTNTPRKQIVRVELAKISDATYDSVNRIMEGLPNHIDVRFSSLSDVCVHQRDVCELCCFVLKEPAAEEDEDKEKEDNTDSVETIIQDEKDVSLVMARGDTRHTAAVFTTCQTKLDSKWAQIVP